jgi:hypothetical protein
MADAKLEIPSAARRGAWQIDARKTQHRWSVIDVAQVSTPSADDEDDLWI